MQAPYNMKQIELAVVLDLTQFLNGQVAEVKLLGISKLAENVTNNVS